MKQSRRLMPLGHDNRGEIDLTQPESRIFDLMAVLHPSDAGGGLSGLFHAVNAFRNLPAFSYVGIPTWTFSCGR